MSRVLWITALLASVPSFAVAAPPDAAPHAMVPSVTGAASGAGDEDRHAAAVAALARAASQPGSRVDDRYRPDGPTDGAAADAARAEAARVAVWTSEEMLEARRYVLEVGKRSARSSEREAQAFLDRLSALSAEQMTVWLQRLQAQRRGVALQRAVKEEAREAQREETLALLREQEAARQSIHQWQGRSAGWLQSRFETERVLTQLRRGERADAIAAQRLQFNPFYPTLDPMTPPASVAAAATLPGDLPRSDPRNFIRGEEGIDFGDGGGVGFAGVSAAPSAPIPAPAAAPAVDVAPAGDAGAAAGGSVGGGE